MSFGKRSGVQTILVVALFLGTALLAAGCCCTCPAYVGATGPEPANVLVVWDDTTQQIAVFPYSVRICERKQKVQWVLMGAPAGTRWDLTFPEGLPFDAQPSTVPRIFPDTGVEKLSDRASAEKGGAGKPMLVAISTAAKAGTSGKRYKYNIKLFFPTGGNAHIDPWVEVDR
jgi:hypothetical protein